MIQLCLIWRSTLGVREALAIMYRSIVLSHRKVMFPFIFYSCFYLIPAYICFLPATCRLISSQFFELIFGLRIASFTVSYRLSRWHTTAPSHLSSSWEGTSILAHPIVHSTKRFPRVSHIFFLRGVSWSYSVQLRGLSNRNVCTKLCFAFKVYRWFVSTSFSGKGSLILAYMRMYARINFHLNQVRFLLLHLPKLFKLIWNVRDESNVNMWHKLKVRTRTTCGP